MSDFRYGKSIMRGGISWYCQTPGTSWKTDPVMGRWELYKTDGGWLLLGPEYVEVSSHTEKLKEAMEWASPIVTGDRNPFYLED